MKSRRIQILLVATLLQFGSVVGCGKVGPFGISVRDASWSKSTLDPTPGIDVASVHFVTLKTGRSPDVSFVVWSDLPRGSGSGRSTMSGASYKGHHRGHDGRQIDFHAETKDGQVGTITINDVVYDLSDGRLLLISTQVDPPIVAQLRFEMSEFPRSTGRLQEFARSHERISAFFEKQKKKSEAHEPQSEMPSDADAVEPRR